MTDSRCIPVEELARVRGLPEDAPERAHIVSCPRCRATLLALAEFERADENLPAAAGAPRAHERLDRAIASLTAEPAASASGPAGGWLRRLFAPPAMRFATGFAALAVIAAGAWLATRPATERSAPAERVVRGEAPGTGAVVRTLDDGWVVTWAPVEGADGYDVVFLDRDDLREVARVEGVREARLELRRAALPAGISPGESLLVEVDAMTGGGVRHVSVPAPIVF